MTASQAPQAHEWTGLRASLLRAVRVLVDERPPATIRGKSPHERLKEVLNAPFHGGADYCPDIFVPMADIARERDPVLWAPVSERDVDGCAESVLWELANVECSYSTSAVWSESAEPRDRQAIAVRAMLDAAWRAEP